MRINSVWVQVKKKYRIKNEDSSAKSRYKARLIVKGFSEKKCIDFKEIFSLVVEISSIGIVLGLLIVQDSEIDKLKQHFFMVIEKK